MSATMRALLDRVDDPAPLLRRAPVDVAADEMRAAYAELERHRFDEAYYPAYEVALHRYYNHLALIDFDAPEEAGDER